MDKFDHLINSIGITLLHFNLEKPETRNPKPETRNPKPAKLYLQMASTDPNYRVRILFLST